MSSGKKEQRHCLQPKLNIIKGNSLEFEQPQFLNIMQKTRVREKNPELFIHDKVVALESENQSHKENCHHRTRNNCWLAEVFFLFTLEPIFSDEPEKASAG